MRSVALLIFSAVALALVEGCETYHPRPLSPRQTAAALESRTFDDPKLQEFVEANLNRKFPAWPPHAWDFSMLTLAALYYHPDMEVALAQWRVAEAGQITAGQRPNPSIALAPGYISNPSRSPWIYGATVNIPIETAGKRGYRQARARRLAQAASLDMETSAWQVRSRLRSALLDLYFSLKSAVVLDRQVDVEKQLANAMEVRLAQGDVARIELTNVQISLAQTRLLLQDAQRQIAENRVRLAAALGLPVSALDQVEISYGFLHTLSPVPSGPEVRR